MVDVAVYAIYLAVILVVALWLRARLIRRGMSSRTSLLVIVLVAVLAWAVPFGDHTLGKMQYERLCREEAGLHIYRKAADVDGYLSPFVSANTPKQEGYKFVEHMDYRGVVTRYVLRDDGTTEETKNVTPASRYAVTMKSEELNRQIVRSEWVIVDSQSRDKLADRIGFVHRGGWLARQFEAMHAYRAQCPQQPFDSTAIIRDVIPPRK